MMDNDTKASTSKTNIDLNPQVDFVRLSCSTATSARNIVPVFIKTGHINQHSDLLRISNNFENTTCTSTSIFALCHSKVLEPVHWCPESINFIVGGGTLLHIKSVERLKAACRDYDLLLNVDEVINVFSTNSYEFNLSFLLQPFQGKIENLEMVMEDFFKVYTHGVLTFSLKSYAIIKHESFYWLFDSHGTNNHDSESLNDNASAFAFHTVSQLMAKLEEMTSTNPQTLFCIVPVFVNVTKRSENAQSSDNVLNIEQELSLYLHSRQLRCGNPRSVLKMSTIDDNKLVLLKPTWLTNLKQKSNQNFRYDDRSISCLNRNSKKSFEETIKNELPSTSNCFGLEPERLVNISRLLKSTSKRRIIELTSLDTGETKNWINKPTCFQHATLNDNIGHGNGNIDDENSNIGHSHGNGNIDNDNIDHGNGNVDVNGNVGHDNGIVGHGSGSVGHKKLPFTFEIGYPKNKTLTSQQNACNVDAMEVEDIDEGVSLSSFSSLSDTSM